MNSQPVPLKEHLETLIALHSKHVDATFAYRDKAVDTALAGVQGDLAKTAAALEERFKNTNEWRNTVESLQRNFAPKEQLESLQKLVYVGLGILLALQFVFGFVIAYWSDK